MEKSQPEDKDFFHNEFNTHKYV